MKVGDIVKLDPYDYPKYKDKLGVIIDKSPARDNRWIVMIDGRIHNFYISSESIEVVDESR